MTSEKKVWDLLKSKTRAEAIGVSDSDWTAFVNKVDVLFEKPKIEKYNLYSDGAARGNPGPSGVGIYIEDAQGNIVKQHFEYLGDQTNNCAEYMALSIGLDIAKDMELDNITVFTDSELMAKQLNGIYKVKNKSLIELYMQVTQKINSFSSIEIQHVTRDKNKNADRLANMAIDSHA